MNRTLRPVVFESIVSKEHFAYKIRKNLQIVKNPIRSINSFGDDPFIINKFYDKLEIYLFQEKEIGAACDS